MCRGWTSDVAAPSALRLLGASWLLTTDNRTAVDALRRLSADGDPRVAQLAAAQLWRTRIAEATTADAQQWQAQIERMGAEIRGGPYFLLGLALARLDQHEDAALALLRAPLLYGQSSPALAAEALLAAGKELDQAGQRDSAATLYREAIANYGATLAGREAEIRLSQLSEETSP